MVKLNVNLIWDDEGNLSVENPSTGEITDIRKFMRDAGGYKFGASGLSNLARGKAVSSTYNASIAANEKYAPKNRTELAMAIVGIIKQTPENETVNLNMLDVSNITDMTGLFSPAPRGINIPDGDRILLNKESGRIDISEWDVSNVTNMGGMFASSQFNGDLSKWDVSNVTNMASMFYYDNHFNNDSLSNWNVSNVGDISYMFIGTDFNGDISNWNVSNVKVMTGVFSRSPFANDISNWDVSNVTNMAYMFSNCPFNGDLSKWDVSNVTDMGSMFEGSSFNNDSLKDWDVTNVDTTKSMFKNSKFNGDISNWRLSSLYNSYDMFEGCPFTGNLDNLMADVTTGVTNLRVGGSSIANMFNGSALEKNDSIPNWWYSRMRKRNPRKENPRRESRNNSYLNKVLERKNFESDLKDLLNN